MQRDWLNVIWGISIYSYYNLPIDYGVSLGKINFRQRTVNKKYLT